mmetsp:Transcript_5699/g.19385  ORF Transcript_5699/g.19385 Transcript_5699/m.19385 type:complete len:236 (+) Transcript_5699:3-710(+)
MRATSMCAARSGIVRLLLIRHGQVIPPSPDCLYGGMDVPLSDFGRRQATAAAEHVADTPLHAVFASPLSRARFGAEEVVKAVAARTSAEPELIIDDGFREIDRGLWGGRDRAEIEAEAPGGLERLKVDAEFAPPEGETMLQLQARVRRAMDAALERTPPGSTSAVVSHMHVTRCMVARALGVGYEAFGDIEIPLGSVSLLEKDAATGELSVVYAGVEPSLGEGVSSDVAGRAWGG